MKPGATLQDEKRRHSVTSVIFLPNIHNLHLIIRQQQTNLKEETFYEITGLHSLQKCQGLESQTKAEEWFQTEKKTKEM